MNTLRTNTLRNVVAASIVMCVGWLHTVANAAEEPKLTVSPIQDSFGDVAPTIKDEYVDVFRNFEPNVNTWYVTFHLLSEANVSLGVAALDPGYNGSQFNVTGIHLDGAPHELIAGPHPFTSTPFDPAQPPIELLLGPVHLTAGNYALGVSGTSDRRAGPFTDGPDFRAHIQVTPIPEPETYALMLAGLGLVSFMARRRQQTT